ncbi:suppressor of fused domain protein [Calidifontibacter sp. DB0510]|uniref:Suppressor of fused domain protein n=1 Tax=Metallococcus carri TaxID=1656884 RepID=A0A967B163_9MICO|nr:suppressor of fused domain protein [Metallococcus carri]NHN56152.1 suppressor of fused domain protein [Metallococcus carri]NOP38797.1 suppressor of fused domain protein [Calidifontibacter sp. DB2511S]
MFGWRRDQSEGGQPVRRHADRRDPAAPTATDPALAPTDPALAAGRDAHLRQFIGADWRVLPGGLGDDRLDVYVFPPSSEHPFLTLVTSGMSDHPMAMPPGLESQSRMELLLALAPGWAGLDPIAPLEASPPGGPLADERNSWPIRLLRDLAQLPRKGGVLSWGQSVPHGDPARPYADGVPFTGAVIGPPIGYSPDLMTCETPVARVAYLAVLPVTRAEMAFTVARPDGAERLFDLFFDCDVSAVIDPQRPSVV